MVVVSCWLHARMVGTHHLSCPMGGPSGADWTSNVQGLGGLLLIPKAPIKEGREVVLLYPLNGGDTWREPRPQYGAALGRDYWGTGASS